MNEETADLSESEMDRIARVLFDASGIRIGQGKRELVRSRLRKRLEVTGLPSYEAYLEYLESHQAVELRFMVEALTTNETYFFREPSHFDVLTARVLRRGGGPIKIWSAASSTGEEPYSIAIRCLEERVRMGGRSVRILATDIDTNVLESARRGVYPEDELRGVAPEYLERYFEPTGEEADPLRGASFQVRREVRSLVSFARLNLMGPWPMNGPLSVVFLRNVMIYFDRPTRAWLGTRVARLLAPGGLLFIGQSESLGVSPKGLRAIQPSVYERTDESVPEAGGRPR
jgi:chemotaxis protein methyltransferase CheR